MAFEESTSSSHRKKSLPQRKDILVIVFHTVMFVRQYALRYRTFALITLLLALFGWGKDNIDVDAIADSFPQGLRVEDEHRPGKEYNRTITMRRPVVVIPGFSTTALELWQAKECAAITLMSSFRKRIFSAGMLLTLMRDSQCYLDHVSLSPESPIKDPEGIKVRPGVGLDSVDFALTGYWVWAKVFVNLGDIGYDDQSLHVATYDWRLAPEEMEIRDQYYTRLKWSVEHMVSVMKAKSVVLAHSYGSVVFTEFLNWAEEKEIGWCEKYVHSFVNIGGPMLGMQKGTVVSFSGEVRDTAMLPSVTRMLLDSRINRHARTLAVRTWGVMYAVQPIGKGWPALLHFRESGEVLDVPTAVEFLANVSERSGHVAFAEGLRRRVREKPPTLPESPSLNVFCIYGVNRPTEVGYYYEGTKEGWTDEDSVIDSEAPNSGVVERSGDGTVPLLSLGYVCRSKSSRGWSQKAGKVITREYPDEPAPLGDLRGGTKAAAHVDILGNYELLHAILDLATGKDDSIEERVTSEIDTLAAAIDRNN